VKNSFGEVKSKEAIVTVSGKTTVILVTIIPKAIIIAHDTE
jgi:hypothetical protein